MLTKVAAYRRLGIITDSDSTKDAERKLMSLPQVTPMLDEIMSGLIERGLPFDPYYYLNSSGDPDAKSLMVIYRSTIPSVRAMLTLEAFCLAAGVDPNSILDSIVKSIERVNALNAAVKLSASQPEVVSKTIQSAMDVENGHKDRRLHMQVSGLMPMPKGARTVVNVQTSASATSAPVQQAVIIPAPPPEQTVRRLSERLNAVRGSLPAPAESGLPDMTTQRIEDAVVVDD